MSTVTPYLHITNGRLRVKVPSVKGSRKEADTLERLLKQHPGVLSVQVNPITANTLVLFDEKNTSANTILQYLIANSYLSTSTIPNPTPRRVNGRPAALTGQTMADSLLEVAVEAAVQAAVRQLIGVLIKAI